MLSLLQAVIKTAEASTWAVVQALKGKLPEMRSLLPDDVNVSYEFDQSIFVINAVKSLMTEGILGAILTGLMVLLFLKDWRSSLVVVVTIPVAILSAVLCLNLSGQSINIMTLSGLALAIGVLVDQATGTIVCAAINEKIIAKPMDNDNGKNIAFGTPCITNDGANTAKIHNKINNNGKDISSQASSMACFFGLPISKCWWIFSMVTVA